MAEIKEITAKIAEALDVAAQCAAASSADHYARLGEKLGALEDSAGKYLRSHTAYQFLVAKLQQEKPLTPDDLKVLRSLIVGDADEYLKYDDDFEQSKAELARILGQIRKLQSADPGPETLMQLRVLCREASSALAPTVHYLEQKQRVQNFEQHMQEPLGSDTRRMLVHVIQDLPS